MKNRWLRYDGIIREVILNVDASGHKDAEIHAILKDGSELVCHHHSPTEEAITILKNSTGKEFVCKVELEH